MANTLSCVYENHDQLNSFIKEHDLHTFPSLLVQVFSGSTEKAAIREVQNSLEWLVPAAKIVGSTTAGEISNGKIYESQIVLSFTTFETTNLTSSLFHLDDFRDSYHMGMTLADELCTFDTKAIIIFSNNFEVDSQELLNGIHMRNPDVLISGGIAGDNGYFGDTYVFSESEISEKGVAAVALSGSNLLFEAYTNHKWQQIGKAFTVTKAIGNTIYSINGKKPLQILKHYLGSDFIEGLPKTGIEFPFLMEVNGQFVSVFISKVLKGGLIQVNRKVPEGGELTFAYASTGLIIEDSLKQMKKLYKKPVETVFVYACVARKMILGDFTHKELQMLQTLGTTTGFFSYGEVSHYKGKGPQIIGHSFTYLAISETKGITGNRSLSFEYEIPEHLNTIMSMTNLMHASQSDMRNLFEELTISEQYYKSLFDNNADFVYSTDLKGNFTSVNPAFEKAFGYNRNDLLGKSAMKFISEEDIPRARMHFLRALKGKEQYYNMEIPTAKETLQVFRIKNIPITVNGVTTGIYGIGYNITEQKRTEEKITQLAYYDYETGLPNRMKFSEQLTEMLQRAKKKKRMLAVIFLDLDRFKIINDSLGHFAGDHILKELVNRIQSLLPSGASFGRFSGDKFTLIFTKNINIEEVRNITKLIIQNIARPVYYENQEFFITASIGVSLFPNDGLDEQLLLKNADIAMNQSKNNGGNQITFFSNEMNHEAIMRLELESYLRKALQKEEFFLCYQPLIDLGSGEVYGSEALIRWNHPRLGLVSPADFIPLAEETGLIEEIGIWVLKTACLQNKKWHELGFEKLSIAVNVSAYQFQQPNFLAEVKNALLDSHLEPHFLTLELTESAMLRNIDYSISIMKNLQDMGVKVSIDDFGTGYSSLSYLRNLPINILKIDRSFINNLRDDTSDIAIVKAIITMGHGLSVKVVAEGVETKEQMTLLRELNCHYAQGYYLNKPLPTKEFEEDLIRKEAVSI